MRAFAFSLLPLALACSAGSGTPSNGPLGDALAQSASVSGVPRDLLVAIAHVEGGLDMPAHRDVSIDSDVPAAGPLMLRRGKLDTLARAAALSGQSELSLRQETDLALEAGAKVLAEVGARTGANADLASWQSAVEEMSGYDDDLHRHEYAHRVFAILAAGGKLAGRDGEEIVLPSHPDIPIALTIDLSPTIRIEGAEYPGAEWFPTSCTNKCDTTRGGNAITGIVIHDTEGGWDASVATLQNDPGKSVHYIVGSDGRVGQFIPESYTGWSVGNYYYNQRTVSIEHVGYSTKPYTEVQYAESAKLVDYLVTKYKVVRDRAHIIGHDQVPDGNVMPESSPVCMDSPSNCEKSGKYGGANNHTDPGIWEWPTYMPRINASAKCDDTGNLWNCGWDLKRAFRCANGKVEVVWCTGPKACVVMPNGQDDQCDMATPNPPPPPMPGNPAPNGTGPNDNGANPPGDGMMKPQSGGCGVSPDAQGGGNAVFALLALGLLASRKRR
jgi:MYXO-CTERM domain-containing protein